MSGGSGNDLLPSNTGESTPLSGGCQELDQVHSSRFAPLGSDAPLWRQLQEMVLRDVKLALEAQFQKQEDRLQELRKELKGDMCKAIDLQLQTERAIIEKLLLRDNANQWVVPPDRPDGAQDRPPAEEEAETCSPKVRIQSRSIYNQESPGDVGEPSGDEVGDRQPEENVGKKDAPPDPRETLMRGPTPVLTKSRSGLSTYSTASGKPSDALKGTWAWLKIQFTPIPTFRQKNAGKPSGLKRLVRSWHFNLFRGLTILVNSSYLTWYSNWMVDNNLKRLNGEDYAKDDFWWILPHVFNFIFCFELVIRIAGERSKFILGPYWHWHLFDIVLIVIPVWNLIFDIQDRKAAEKIPNISFFRIITVIRVIDQFPIFRMPIFAELRMMLNSMLRSLPSFGWAVLIATFFMYIFGVGFLLGVSRHLNAIDLPMLGREPEVSAMKKHFASLWETMKVLLMSVSNGVDWEDVFKTVSYLDTIYPLFFIFYIVFMLYAMLNIISGMFIERAFKVVAQDRDFGIVEEATEQRFLEDRLRGLFNELDIDRNGKLSWDEFQANLHNPHVMAYFNWLGIDTSQADDVFALLDTNGDNIIKVDEFLAGCSQLRGGATNVEVKMLRTMMEIQGNQTLELLAQRRSEPSETLSPLTPRPATWTPCREDSARSNVSNFGRSAYSMRFRDTLSGDLARQKIATRMATSVGNKE